MGRPKIKMPEPPAAPPPTPIIPAAPEFGRTEEEKLKRKLFDPKRVGRKQTILTGLMGSQAKKQTLGG